MMLRLFVAMMRWFSTVLRGGTRPRFLSTSSFEIIDTSRKVDEELLAHYKPSRFYPVRIQDTLGSRYKVLSKLGYGSCSTVWLSRDITCVNSPSQTLISVTKSQRTKICRAESLYFRLSEY